LISSIRQEEMIVISSTGNGARPARPADLKWKPEPPGPLEPLRRGLKRLVVHASDRRWLGLTPLQTHVIICGFPRSGSTLLLLMAETSCPHAKTFHQEKTGLKAARQFWPGRHPLMITKRPNDVFWVDEIREFYQSRAARPLFIFCARDPRAVLTSFHDSQSGYYVSPERWKAMYDHFQYVRRYPDVLTVEFSDLIRKPAKVQERLTAFIGWRPITEFDRYLTAVPPGFDTLALNGVRPLDPAAIEKWKAPKHRDRMQQILKALPQLPDILIEQGYERDTSWTEAYR